MSEGGRASAVWRGPITHPSRGRVQWYCARARILPGTAETWPAVHTHVYLQGPSPAGAPPTVGARALEARPGFLNPKGSEGATA